MNAPAAPAALTGLELPSPEADQTATMAPNEITSAANPTAPHLIVARPRNTAKPVRWRSLRKVGPTNGWPGVPDGHRRFNNVGKAEHLAQAVSELGHIVVPAGVAEFESVAPQQRLEVSREFARPRQGRTVDDGSATGRYYQLSADRAQREEDCRNRSSSAGRSPIELSVWKRPVCV